MSDERTPLVHTDGDCKCGQFHPTDERTPTAEPVSRWQAFLDHPRIHFNVDANRQFALQWLEDAEAEIRAEAAQRSKESLIAEGKTIMRLDTVRDLTARAEAAQRSTAEVERLRELNVALSDEAAADLERAQRFAKGLTVYASHLGNCPYESWNKPLTKCECGLFALLKQARATLAEPDHDPA
jgi:hypothetical protein